MSRGRRSRARPATAWPGRRPRVASDRQPGEPEAVLGGHRAWSASSHGERLRGALIASSRIVSKCVLDRLVDLGRRPVLRPPSPWTLACSVDLAASDRRRLAAARAAGRGARAGSPAARGILGWSNSCAGEQVEARRAARRRTVRAGRAGPRRPRRLASGDELRAASRPAQSREVAGRAVRRGGRRAPRGPAAGRTRRPARSGRGRGRRASRGARRPAPRRGSRRRSTRRGRRSRGRPRPRRRAGGATAPQNSWNVPIGAASSPRRTAASGPGRSPGVEPGAALAAGSAGAARGPPSR